MSAAPLFGPRLRGNISRALHNEPRKTGTRKGVLYEITKRTEVPSGQLRLPASGGGSLKEKPFRWACKIRGQFYGDTASTVYECLNQIEAANDRDASTPRPKEKRPA